jgi:hypothetical protein
MARSPFRARTIVEARFICSDGDCDAEGIVIGPLEELDSLGCDCGAALQIIGWPVRPERETGRDLIIWLD